MIELTSKKLIKSIISVFKEEEKRDIEQAELVKEDDSTYLVFSDGERYSVAIYKEEKRKNKNEQS